MPHAPDDIRAQLDLILAAVTPARSAPFTVRELWDLFARSESTRLASWRDYDQRWRQHVGPSFGDLDVTAVSVEHVDAYRARRLAAATARGALTKLATVNREIALLRRLLSFGKRRGKLTASPLHGPGMTRELIHREKNARTTIVEDNPRAELSIATFLAAAPLTLKAFLRLLHHSGMRRGEAARLRWDRVNLDEGRAWIPDCETKGHSAGRLVPLSPEVVAELRALPRLSDYVFANPRRSGRPWHKDHWTKSFRRLCRKLDLTGPDGPPWLHDLRRSFITLTRRRGEDTTSIMKISGHKTLEAFSRYNVFSTIDFAAAKERIESARAHEMGLLRGKRKGPHRAFSKNFVDSVLKSCL